MGYGDYVLQETLLRQKTGVQAPHASGTGWLTGSERESEREREREGGRKGESASEKEELESEKVRE